MLAGCQGYALVPTPLFGVGYVVEWDHDGDGWIRGARGCFDFVREADRNPLDLSEPRQLTRGGLGPEGLDSIRFTSDEESNVVVLEMFDREGTVFEERTLDVSEFGDGGVLDFESASPAGVEYSVGLEFGRPSCSQT